MFNSEQRNFTAESTCDVRLQERGKLRHRHFVFNLSICFLFFYRDSNQLREAVGRG